MRNLRFPILVGFCLFATNAWTQEFRRGDANNDGVVDLSDGAFTAQYLFLGGSEPSCLNAADADDDDSLTLSDTVFTLNYWVGQGVAPAAPGPFICGPDPDADPAGGLPCAAYSCDPRPIPPVAPEFQLSFDAPDFVTFDSTRGVTPFQARVLLEVPKNEQIIAWTLGIRSSCLIAAATLEDTVASRHFASGFERTELVPTSHGSGLRSTVVLSFTAPASLPIGTSDLLRFGVRSTRPTAGCHDCTLEFSDRLVDADSQAGTRLTRMQVDPGGVASPTTIRSSRHGRRVRICCPAEAAELGTATNFVLSDKERSACFVFPAFAAADQGKAVRLTVSDESPLSSNLVYARWGGPATSTEFDAAATLRGRADQTLVLPYTQQAELHVSVVSAGFGTPRSTLRLEASLASILIDGIADRRSAVGGDFSTVITGAGFESDTIFQLVHKDTGHRIPVEISRLLSHRRVEVDLDLSNAAPGPYRLVARNGLIPIPGQEDSLEDAFEVSADDFGEVLRFHIEAPARYRVDRIRTLTLLCENTGSTAVPSPIVEMLPPESSTIRLAGRQFDTSALVLVVDKSSVPGQLAPGAVVEIPFEYISTEIGEGHFEAKLFRPSGALDWDSLLAPAELDQAEWDLVRPALELELGSDWPEVHRSLLTLARSLTPRGQQSWSVDELIRYAARRALGRASTAVLGTVRDEQGQAIAGRVVSFSVLGSIHSTSTTDRLGRFAVDWLDEETSYEIGVDGHDTAGFTVTTPPLDVLGGDIYGIEVTATVAANVVEPNCSRCDETLLPIESFEFDPSLFATVARAATTVISSRDPNSKDGPAGEGKGGFIPPAETMHYTIHFENKAADGQEQLTFPAQEVFLSDELELDLDLSTLRFRSIGWGDRVVNFPGGGGNDLLNGYSSSPDDESYLVREDVEFATDEGPLNLAVEAYVDPDTRIAHWFFQTQDLGTGLLTTLDEQGFLPVEDGTGRGQGFVTFTIQVNPEDEVCDEKDCEEIRNDADITFDTNEVIPTPEIVHPISRTLPPGPPEFPIPPDLSDFPLSPTISVTDSLWWQSSRAASFEVFVWKDGEAKPESGTITQLSVYKSPGSFEPSTLYRWQVIARNSSGDEAPGPEWSFETEAGRAFVRGDADASGVIDISDAIFALAHLFSGGPSPTCLEAADTNDDERFDLSDPINLLSFLFLGGPPPLAPTPTPSTDYDTASCGPDNTAGVEPDVDLGCESFVPCDV